MPSLNLGRIVSSPRFAQTLMVTTRKGVYVAGGYSTVSSPPVPAYGTMTPAKSRDLAQVPEGDRTEGAMSFISQTRLSQTWTAGVGGQSGLSDTVEWRGRTYRVASVEEWGDFGFWRHILIEERT